MITEPPPTNSTTLLFKKKLSRIRETPNLLADADSSTNIFVSAGIKKVADSRHRRRRLPKGFLAKTKEPKNKQKRETVPLLTSDMGEKTLSVLAQ